MDRLDVTTSANAFRTPSRILIPKLARSRDQWKAKATARKQLQRREKIHSRDLQLSRQRCTERAVQAEQKLLELQQQLQHAQAELTAARAHIDQLPEPKKNLNLIERLWKFVKKQVLYGRHYATFQEFRAAIDGCLAKIPTEHREKLQSLMTHHFQTFNPASFLIA